MRFIERIRSKLFPVRPDLFQNLWVVSVFLSAFQKEWFQVIKLIFQLFTHGFTQGITLAAGKIGQQTRE
jgi:hypothetical protein